MRTQIRSYLLLIAVLLVFQTLAFAQERAVIESELANFREGPGMNSRVIRQIPKGEEVEITKQSGNWYFVRHGETEGWLHKNTLSVFVMARRMGVLTILGDRDVNAADAVAVSRKDYWVNVATVNEVSYQVNESETGRSGDFVSLWVRKFSRGSVNELHFYDIDCRENEYRYFGRAIYDENDKFIKADTYPLSEAEFEPIVSGDVLEKIQSKVCTQGFNTQIAPSLETRTLAPAPLKISSTDPPPPPPVPRTISGGVVNRRAISLPAPAYPAAARAVGASGAVSVQVLIDEDGKVISASAVSGHPLLRAAAVTAARQAVFPPTTLSGQPVKMSGVITYVFNK